MVNSARHLKAHALSTGKIGATVFCWEGGTTNFLLVALGDDLNATVPIYGVTPATGDEARINAPLPFHYAENDEHINAIRPS